MKAETIFKRICKENDGIIKTREVIAPFCFEIKNGKVKTIALPLNKIDKCEVKRVLLKNLANQKLDGYIIVFDCKLTRVGNEIQVCGDAVVRTLYTPQEKTQEIVEYKDKKIISKRTLRGRRDSKDDWDLWGERNALGDELIQDYLFFRTNNPELYDEPKDL